VYGEAIRAHGYSALYLDDDIKLKEVHAAIYDKSRGIKATLPDVSDWSRDCLRSAALRLIEDGVEQIILGCTEIPFAIGSMTFQVPTINPSEALAATLIQRATHDG
jgi:aspartate racemase